MRSLLLASALVGVTGCGIIDPLPNACTLEFRYGLSVTVADSVAGTPPPSATLVARSGTFVDSIAPIGPIDVDGHSVLLFISAGERPGFYDLVVHSPGYKDWT